MKNRIVILLLLMISSISGIASASSNIYCTPAGADLYMGDWFVCGGSSTPVTTNFQGNAHVGYIGYITESFYVTSGDYHIDLEETMYVHEQGGVQLTPLDSGTRIGIAIHTTNTGTLKYTVDGAWLGTVDVSGTNHITYDFVSANYGYHTVCAFNIVDENNVCIGITLSAPAETNPTDVTIVGEGSVRILDNGNYVDITSLSDTYDMEVGHSMTVDSPTPAEGYTYDEMCYETQCTSNTYMSMSILPGGNSPIVVHFISNTPIINTIVIVNVDGYGSIDVSDNGIFIESINASKSYTIQVGHNITLNNPVADANYQFGSFCHASGCTNIPSVIATIPALDFYTMVVHFVPYDLNNPPIENTQMRNVVINFNVINEGSLWLYVNNSYLMSISTSTTVQIPNGSTFKFTSDANQGYYFKSCTRVGYLLCGANNVYDITINNTFNIIWDVLNVGTVNFVTNPSGANIFLNGTFVGVTPMTLELNGQYSYVGYFSKQGYRQSNFSEYVPQTGIISANMVLLTDDPTPTYTPTPTTTSPTGSIPISNNEFAVNGFFDNIVLIVWIVFSIGITGLLMSYSIDVGILSGIAMFTIGGFMFSSYIMGAMVVICVLVLVARVSR